MLNLFSLIIINRRIDGGTLRRIHLFQRNKSCIGKIPTARVIVPQEIGVLKDSQICITTLGIEFIEISDKAHALSAHFHIKSDRGSSPVFDITPTLGEIVKPYQLSNAEFDSAIEKLRGIHQRGVASFNTNLMEKREDLISQISKHTNLVSFLDVYSSALLTSLL